MLLTFHIVMLCIFVILGIVFSCGGGAGLIAGYNTSSAAKKAKIDEKALCSFMGKFMFVLAACWIIIMCSEIFKTMTLLWIGFGLFIAVTVGAVIYMNTGNRFKKQ